MKETLKKLSLQTCEDSPSATFSQGLVDGALPFDLQDGMMRDQFGQEAHHANPLALQGKEKALQTSDTSPQSGSISSKSADLQSYLASKLQQRLPKTAGWTLYKMHWKTKATPQGRQYCQLVASTPRTSANDSGLRQGWRTPIQSDGEGGVRDAVELKKTDKSPKLKLRDQAALTGWPTPRVGGNGAASKKREETLETRGNIEQAAVLAGWPTPITSDYRDRGKWDDPAIQRRKEIGKSIELSMMVGVVGWPTPMTADQRKYGHGLDLNMASQFAQPMRQKPNGEILTGSGAEMESGGQLNPAHSRWLMGYPPEWDDCGVTAMPSSRKSQRKSSKL